MQKKIILLLFVIPFQLIFAQGYNKGIYFEVNMSPRDSGGICFLSYRIAYNHLVFTKENNEFKARFSIIFEASDSAGSKYTRDIIERTIIASTYEQTDDENTYSQGLLKVPLSNGNYKILPVLNDYNAGKEYRWLPIYIKVGKADSQNIFSPLVVQKNNNTCSGSQSYLLANFEGDLIFSPENYDLIIPVKDLSVQNIEVQFENNDSVFAKLSPDSSFTGSISLTECQNKIFLETTEESEDTKFFRFSGVNTNLKEGKIKINIFIDNKSERSFEKNVIWANKPNSLNNTDFAVRILRYLTGKSEIASLNKKSDQKIYSSLFEFWKKYDPTPATSFNELMYEYYERVDYSIENFSLIGTMNGADSDRGEIYVLYGKPDLIKRNYSGSNQTKEIWIYNNPENTFVFVDKTGLGDFSLEKNL